MKNNTESRGEDMKSKIEQRLKLLADEYNIHSVEEFSKTYEKMEPIDITIFVTPLEKLRSSEPIKRVC